MSVVGRRPRSIDAVAPARTIRLPRSPPPIDESAPSLSEVPFGAINTDYHPLADRNSQASSEVTARLQTFDEVQQPLTQAEAVLGVIDATTREDLDVALSQLAGGLATPLSALRGQLVDLLADLESLRTRIASTPAL